MRLIYRVGMFVLALVLLLPVFTVPARAAEEILVIDYGDPGYAETGTWYASSLQGYNGSGSRYAQTAGSRATWTAMPAAGVYRVSAYNIVHPYNTAAVSYSVYHSLGTDTVSIPGQTGGSGWADLGLYYYNGSGPGIVALTTGPSGATRADAVSFERLAISPAAALIEPAGETGVSAYTSVRLLFNKPMDAVTIDEASVLLTDDATSLTVQASLTLEGHNQVILIPEERLAFDRSYTVSLAGTILDMEALPLTGQTSWSFTTVAASNPVKSYYVSPTGSDANPGTEAQPFATVTRARDVIRQFNGNMDGDTTVYIREGTYTPEETLAFGAEDSGSNGFDVVYRNYPGEHPVISGGAPVTGWTEEDGLWRADWAGPAFRQLYVNGQRAVRAQTGIFRHGTGWSDSGDGILVQASTVGELGSWANPGDMEVHWPRGWRDTRLPVDSVISVTSGTYEIRFEQPYLDWALTSGAQDFKPDPAYGFYLENALELLDSPGEWYLDRSAETVYYMPRSGEQLSTAEVTAPVLDTLLAVKGTLEAPVRHLRFEGLAFAHGTWLRPSGQGSTTLQADVIADGLNQAGSRHQGVIIPGQLQIEAAEHIALTGSVVEHMGAAGISVRGAAGIELSGNIFRDISAAAVIAGTMADAYPLDARQVVRDSRIVNNVIYDTAKEYWGSAGITAFYVNGLTIAHNELWGLPYSGISAGWGWSVQPNSTTAGNNVIEANHVRHYGELLYDLGGIYTLGQQPGTVIRRNLVHDSPNEAGIYLDAGSSYIDVGENITYNVHIDLHNSGLNQGNSSSNNYWGVAPGDNDADYSPVFSGVPPAPNTKPLDAGFPVGLAGAAGLEQEYAALLAGLTPGAMARPAADSSDSAVIVLDNSNPGYLETGDWGRSSIQGLDSKPTRYGYSIGASAEWELDVAPGLYRLLYFKPVHANGDPSAQLEITHSLGTSTTGIDLSAGSSGLAWIGNYQLGSGSAEKVRITRMTNPTGNGYGFIRTDSLVLERIGD
ncbi:MAG: hypothetical protein K0R57_2378 [Paenibacillaceae bacterium]|jgi:hypothetical protein|nr:hypothetical protein [Paenibacillaceae bacterium]